MGKFKPTPLPKKNDEVIVLADTSSSTQPPSFTPKRRKRERRSESDVESVSVSSGVDTTSETAILVNKRNKQTLIWGKIFIAVVFVVVAIVLPCVVFLTVYDGELLVFPYGSCDLKPEFRMACEMGIKDMNLQRCESVNCCWNDTTKECYHSIPSRYTYYILQNSEGKSAGLRTGNTVIPENMTARLKTTPFNNPSHEKLQLFVVTLNENHLKIFLSHGENEERLEEIQSSQTAIHESNFEDIQYKKTFALDINRRDTGKTMISTSFGLLIASDNYWEIAIQCPEHGSVYGLGRLIPNNLTLMYNSQFRTGSHPFFMCLNEEGDAHGVFVKNTEPIEAAYLNVSNVVVFRGISKTGWDINVFAGPTPKDVMNQYTEVIGKPKLPPYWALGLHVCRDFTTNSTNTTHLNVTELMKEFNDFRVSANDMDLLYESDCIHQKLLNSLNFTASQKIIESIDGIFQTLHNDQKRFLLSLPPQNLEVDDDVCIKNDINDNTAYRGTYFGRSNVKYPDFSNEKTTKWMADNLKLLTSTPMSQVLSGFLLYDNWPADENIYNRTEDRKELPYIPLALNGSLSNNTLWWIAQHSGNTSHYEIHNTYGILQAQCVAQASKIANPFILTASCYPSGNVLGCMHQNSANPAATWENLKEALISVLAQGLSGVPLASGGPICGAVGNYTDELCLRWYMMGITFPLMRVSSEYPLRDPVSLTSSYMRTSVTNALTFRYSLLPYLYTLLQEAHESGTPLVRPMFFEFPQDKGTWQLVEQYMLGSSILIAPAMYEKAVTVDVYLPETVEGNITWYHLMGGHPVNNNTGNVTVTISSLEAEIIMLVRAGSIIPMQEPDRDAVSSKTGNYKLVIALHCDESNRSSCRASGRMKLEDIETPISLVANSSSVTISNLTEACNKITLPPLTEYQVYGLKLFVPPTIKPTSPTTATSFDETPTEDSTTETIETDDMSTTEEETSSDLTTTPVEDSTVTEEITGEESAQTDSNNTETNTTDEYETNDSTDDSYSNIDFGSESNIIINITAVNYNLCANGDSVTILFSE